MVTPAELEHIISSPRFATFVDLADGDRQLAADLYDWTGKIAGALFTDFRILEVAYRNRIDGAIADHVATIAPHVTDWFWDQSWIPPAGHWWDRGATNALRTARQRPEPTPRRRRRRTHLRLLAVHPRWPLRGIVLEHRARHRIHRHPRSRTRRCHTLEQAIINLHGLRNRLAHHEPIAKPWTRRIPGGASRAFPLDELYQDLVAVLRWTAPAHAPQLLASSRIPALLASRPN